MFLSVRELHCVRVVGRDGAVVEDAGRVVCGNMLRVQTYRYALHNFLSGWELAGIWGAERDSYHPSYA